MAGLGKITNADARPNQTFRICWGMTMKLDPTKAMTMVAYGDYDELVAEREFQAALTHERHLRETAQGALQELAEARDAALDQCEFWRTWALRLGAVAAGLGALALVGLGYLLGR